MRDRPITRDEYAALKVRLAPLLATDRAAYTAGKSTFIYELLALGSAGS